MAKVTKATHLPQKMAAHLARMHLSQWSNGGWNCDIVIKLLKKITRNVCNQRLQPALDRCAALMTSGAWDNWNSMPAHILKVKNWSSLISKRQTGNGHVLHAMSLMIAFLWWSLLVTGDDFADNWCDSEPKRLEGVWGDADFRAMDTEGERLLWKSNLVDFSGFAAAAVLMCFSRTPAR